MNYMPDTRLALCRDASRPWLSLFSLMIARSKPLPEDLSCLPSGKRVPPIFISVSLLFS
jgi:hypothetical protein